MWLKLKMYKNVFKKKNCLQNSRKGTSWIVLLIPIFKTPQLLFCFGFTHHSLRHKSFKTSSRLHPLTSFVSIRASLQTNPYPVIPVPSQVTGVTQIIGTSTSNASFREGTAASSVVWRRKVFNRRCQPWSSCNRDDQYSNGLLLHDMLLK